MRRTHWIVLLFLLVSVIPVVSEAQVYTTQQGHAQFNAKSTLGNFTGQSNHLRGKIDLADSSVSFTINLTTLHTGIKLRDKHMRDYLQTNKFPYARFSGKIVTPFDTTSADSQKVTVKGTFEVHGVSRNVAIHGVLLIKPASLYVRASWKLLVTDYKIKTPVLLFLKVNPLQVCSMHAVLMRRGGMSSEY